VTGILERPKKVLNGAHPGPGGRIISYRHCAVHPCTEKIIWPDGREECAMCARDRQEALMTPRQRKNVAFNMPKYVDWVPPPLIDELGKK